MTTTVDTEDRFGLAVRSLAANVGGLHAVDCLELSGTSTKKLTDDHLKTLTEALKKSEKFEGSLDLSSNSITDLGILTLTTGLKEIISTAAESGKPCVKVTGLNLSNCKNVGDRGAQLLASVLEISPFLTSVDVRGTGIGDEGVTALCDAVRLQRTARSLSLGVVGRDGLRVVIDTLRSVKSLETLRLTAKDVERVAAYRESLSPEDFNVADYVRQKSEDEEEEEEGAGEGEEEEGSKTKKGGFGATLPPDDVLSVTSEDADRIYAEAPGMLSRETNTLPEGLLTFDDLKALQPEVYALSDAQLPLYLLLRDLVRAADSCPRLTEIGVQIKPVGKGGDPIRVVGSITNATETEYPDECERTTKLFPSIGKDLRQVCVDHLRGMLEKEQALRLDESITQGEYVKKLAEEIIRGIPEEESHSFLPLRSYVNRSLRHTLSEGLYALQKCKARGNAAVQSPAGELAFLSYFVDKRTQNPDFQVLG
uniref:Uncharacterized protein n=1 Tax=Chromera velia CCMP2878 TaxID=1169474 RepID=A0A0G4FMQ2_9ALVE|mmetsp:Transcript_47859/g.94426  ORF Transcript_47859/g.94426 Transcript_47859/m.94426 type:complete len:481 (+) Transcript_47859:99-1541(+)|eukprot:Cvel_3497.t1-p1 / transcript=Cvel_3497.t1 / gene=Cvel_3497 / organism=Chromera_velia_CCMP2878 / gene_product=hypothetical protein / transcript_product=hypothetical protein / location=Cvel_scaffold141:81820-84118(+) / protein_length=480 / sequence_SO=supercontig / SO=protein_coding / is_pseudo=false